MTPTSDDLRRAEDGILDILETTGTSYPPTQLIERLKRQDISEYSARVAIWYLIDRNRIELTLDRLLRPVQQDGAEQSYRDPVLARG